MSRSARLGIVLAAVVVLVVGFVVLGNASDDSPSSPAADVITTSGGAATPTPNPSASAAPSSSATQAARPAEPAEPTIAVRGGAISGDPKALEFSGGERVRFRVTSDEPVEVHVHGYDVEEAAAPGRPAEFSFAPKIQGAYDIELHPSEVQIGTLEVAP
jgi:hypothetical protein